MHVGHDLVAGLLQPHHGLGQDVAGDRLGDVLDDAPAVGVDLERRGALAAGEIGQASVVGDLRAAVVQAASAYQVDGQPADRGILAGPAGAARKPLRAAAPKGRVGGRLGLAPQRLDALVGVAPHAHHLGQLRLGDAHGERAHALERLGAALVAQRQRGHLAALAQILAYLVDRHAEHAARRRLVDLPVAAEDVEHPLLAGEPREHASLDRTEVRHREDVPLAGHEHGAHEGLERVLDVAVEQLQRLGVALAGERAGIVQGVAREAPAGEVLQLHQAAGPAARRGPVELEAAPQPPVGAGGVAGDGVLLDAALGARQAQPDRLAGERVAALAGRLGLERLAPAALDRAAPPLQPLEQLRGAVGVGQARDRSQPLLGGGGVSLGHGARGRREAGVHARPAVVDPLVEDVEPLLPLRDRARELRGHLHLAVDVAGAVGDEAPPVPAIEGDGLGRRLRELVDEAGAGGVLLSVDVQERGDLLEAALHAPVGRLRHRAAPRGRPDVRALGHAQHAAQAHALEHRVERMLHDARIHERQEQPVRQLIARQVDHSRRLPVPRIPEQQHPEVGCCRVLVDAHRGQVGRAAGLYVDRQMPHGHG